MRKNKFVYTLSALMMACIISFSGVGGSYIQAEATSVGITPGVWNDDVSAWENIRHYLELFAAAWGIYVSPNVSTVLWGVDAHNDFYNFMVADDYTEEEAEECVHGGGGHVRDGISVDDAGNVTYSDEVSDLFHDYICNYLETESGYWVVETVSADEIPVEWFHGETTMHSNVVETIKNFGYCYFSVEEYEDSLKDVSLGALDSLDFVLTGGISSFSPDSYFRTIRLDESGVDGVSHKGSGSFIYNGSSISMDSYKIRSYTLDEVGKSFTSTRNFYFCNYEFLVDNYTAHKFVVSSDGRLVKVFKGISAFKNYNMKQQPYYLTQNWVNYDASQDNSITMTSAEYQYYSDNSTTIYQNIQNNIDNSGSDLTEQDIQKIVDDAVKEIKDSIPDNSGSGDSGSDDSGSDDDGGGTGVGDLIEGIGKIFDTILSLIGKLMGVVADFTQSILDLFSGFTTFTDGFSDFLAGAFGFIPPEIWDIVKVGMSLMVLLAVIKFLRK